MGHKDKRKAAACATAVRMTAFHALPSVDIEDAVIVDSDSDYGYDGGVDGGILFRFGYHRSSNAG